MADHRKQLLFDIADKNTLKRKNPDYVASQAIHFPTLKGSPSEDPIVIPILVFDIKIHRAYIDGGSECDIIYEHCFLQLPKAIKVRMTPPQTPLIGFAGEKVSPLGEIDLDVTIGDPPFVRTETLDFIVVRSPSPYNILLGRPAMRRLGIIASTIHSLIKHQTPNGVGTIYSEYDRTKHVHGVKKAKEPIEAKTEVLRPSDYEQKIIVNPAFPEQQISIGKLLPEDLKKKLQKLLQRNIDVFAWEYTDMTGVPRVINVDGEEFITEHRLNERRDITPFHQKRRYLAVERDLAACKEVEELAKAGIIRKSKYPTWGANLVMVRKSDGGWRMCVDFTNINKACPKDCYPLPEIDWKVER